MVLLGGALEYQRSANRLSSLDNVIDMEQEALRSAVAQITAVRPDILLVERSVARYEHVCPNFRQGVNMSTLQGRGQRRSNMRGRCTRSCSHNPPMPHVYSTLFLPFRVVHVFHVSYGPPPLPHASPPPLLRYAQELLREAGVSLVLNLKPELLERLARCLGTKVCVALWRGGALG